MLSVSKRVACVSSCLCCSPFNCRCGSPVCRGRITGMYFLHARARIHAFCIVRETRLLNFNTLQNTYSFFGPFSIFFSFFLMLLILIIRLGI